MDISVEHWQEFLDGLELLGLDVKEKDLNKLKLYAQLIYKWNKVYNLTAVRTIEGILHKHLLDSLSITKYIENDTRVIDIGTGAGLPGIPLAIIRPDIIVALADSNVRKASFLRQVISDLALSNAGVVHSRIEDFVPKERFNIAVSRAFSSLANLAEVSKVLLADNGYILAMKGMYPSAELDEIDYPYEVFDLRVFDDELQRHLVLIETDNVKG